MCDRQARGAFVHIPIQSQCSLSLSIVCRRDDERLCDVFSLPLCWDQRITQLDTRGLDSGEVPRTSWLGWCELDHRTNLHWRPCWISITSRQQSFRQRSTNTSAMDEEESEVVYLFTNTVSQVPFHKYSPRTPGHTPRTGFSMSERSMAA